MSLSLVISELSFMTGDQPYIKAAQISDDKLGFIGSNELLFATIRGTQERNYILLEESKVELNSDSFDFKFPEPVEPYQYGKIWVRGYWKESIVTTLDGDITENALEADLTVSSGSIPESGHILINDEVCSFTRISSTKISIQRGQFKTSAVSHTNGDSVGFSISNETCINSQNIRFENQEGDLFRIVSYGEY